MGQVAALLLRRETILRIGTQLKWCIPHLGTRVPGPHRWCVPHLGTRASHPHRWCVPHLGTPASRPHRWCIPHLSTRVSRPHRWCIPHLGTRVSYPHRWCVPHLGTRVSGPHRWCVPHLESSFFVVPTEYSGMKRLSDISCRGRSGCSTAVPVYQDKLVRKRVQRVPSIDGFHLSDRETIIRNESAIRTPIARMTHIIRGNAEHRQNVRLARLAGEPLHRRNHLYGLSRCLRQR